ncbi:type 4a pilus biogenesis protein PilO [Patescibacteria group bacterium]|nr:type 4a pilus biogenesis protein PilO [Patescibacteria group bacterium]
MSEVHKHPSKLLTEYYSSLFFLLILLFLGASIFVIKPKLDEVKQTNAAIASSLDKLSSETVYLNSLEGSVAAAGAISPAVLDKVDSAMPREAEIPELLVLFSSAAERDNVKIMNVNFAEARTAKAARPLASATSSVSGITINMSVAAINYPQIKRFLKNIERSLRIMDIEGINVASRGEESVYAIQLKTYVYAPATGAVTPK